MSDAKKRWSGSRWNIFFQLVYWYPDWRRGFEFRADIYSFDASIFGIGLHINYAHYTDKGVTNGQEMV